MVVRTFGGPYVIEREEFDPGAPGPGEVLVANEAIGLNFIDTYFRTGDITAGAGVDVVFDGVGTDSWNASLACLQQRVLMVS